MMKTTLKAAALLILFFIAHQTLAQTNYLPGYIINLSDQKIEGYIDYQNWDESPRKVNFKKQLANRKIEYTPKNIKQFGVKDEVYIGAKVAIEVSPYQVHQLSYESALEIDTVQAFLQTVIQGDKSLYHYKDGFSKDNFYILIDDTFKLLTYKKHIEVQDGQRKIVQNKNYIGQLIYYLRDCPNIRKQLNRKEYTKTDLEAVFLHYYDCTQSEFDFQKKTEKVKAELGLVAGLSSSTIRFSRHKNDSNFLFSDLIRVDFSNSINFSGGLFLELIFPRIRNKWSLYSELLYSAYDVKGVSTNVTTPDFYTNTYLNFQFSYIKLNNLFRYRQPLGNARIFINAGFSNGFAISNSNSQSREQFSGTSSTLVHQGTRLTKKETRTYEQGLLAGLGIQYNNFSLELRHEAGNAMSKYTHLKSVSKRNFILLGYRF